MIELKITDLEQEPSSIFDFIKYIYPAIDFNIDKENSKYNHLIKHVTSIFKKEKELIAKVLNSAKTNIKIAEFETKFTENCSELLLNIIDKKSEISYKKASSSIGQNIRKNLRIILAKENIAAAKKPSKFNSKINKTTQKIITTIINQNKKLLEYRDIVQYIANIKEYLQKSLNSKYKNLEEQLHSKLKPIITKENISKTASKVLNSEDIINKHFEKIAEAFNNCSNINLTLNSLDNFINTIEDQNVISKAIISNITTHMMEQSIVGLVNKDGQELATENIRKIFDEHQNSIIKCFELPSEKIKVIFNNMHKKHKLNLISWLKDNTELKNNIKEILDNILTSNETFYDNAKVAISKEIDKYYREIMDKDKFFKLYSEAISSKEISIEYINQVFTALNASILEKTNSSYKINRLPKFAQEQLKIDIKEKLAKDKEAFRLNLNNNVCGEYSIPLSNKQVDVKEIKILGDGRCMSHAIYHSLKLNHPKKLKAFGINSSTDLTNKIIATIEQDTTAKNYWDSFASNEEKQVFNNDFNKYLTDVAAKKSYWFGEFEITKGIVPLLKKLQVPFNIYYRPTAENSVQKTKNYNASFKDTLPVNIVHVEGNHYNCLIEKDKFLSKLPKITYTDLIEYFKDVEKNTVENIIKPYELLSTHDILYNSVHFVARKLRKYISSQMPTFKGITWQDKFSTLSEEEQYKVITKISNCITDYYNSPDKKPLALSKKKSIEINKELLNEHINSHNKSESNLLKNKNTEINEKLDNSVDYYDNLIILELTADEYKKFKEMAFSKKLRYYERINQELSEFNDYTSKNAFKNNPKFTNLVKFRQIIDNIKSSININNPSNYSLINSLNKYLYKYNDNNNNNNNNNNNISNKKIPDIFLNSAHKDLLKRLFQTFGIKNSHKINNQKTIWEHFENQIKAKGLESAAKEINPIVKKAKKDFEFYLNLILRIIFYAIAGAIIGSLIPIATLTSTLILAVIGGYIGYIINNENANTVSNFANNVMSVLDYINPISWIQYFVNKKNNNSNLKSSSIYTQLESHFDDNITELTNKIADIKKKTKEYNNYRTVNVKNLPTNTNVMADTVYIAGNECKFQSIFGNIITIELAEDDKSLIYEKMSDFHTKDITTKLNEYEKQDKGIEYSIDILKKECLDLLSLLIKQENTPKPKKPSIMFLHKKYKQPNTQKILNDITEIASLGKTLKKKIKLK